MLLGSKTAVVYGAAGSVGSAVASAFAREGASVFLAGRRLPGVQAVADQIEQAGGTAHAASVDALDEAAAVAHATRSSSGWATSTFRSTRARSTTSKVSRSHE